MKSILSAAALLAALAAPAFAEEAATAPSQPAPASEDASSLPSPSRR